MSVKADAETLRTIPIFADCDTVHLQLLAFSSERCQFAAGDTLVRQGEAGSDAYLLLNGEVRLTDGEETVGLAGPGAFIGEMAMIGQIAYGVTALALGPVSAARIGRSLFMRVAEEYPEFGATVFRALAQRFDRHMAELDPVKNLFDRAQSFKRQDRF
jgi:CRP/FNR family cyclic AMP-dependent transcriptional regulator